jgi:hypothetical protein
VVWTLRGCRDLTLSLIVRVKKMPQGAPSQSAVQGRPVRVRVPDLRLKLGTKGHPAARIRRQWTCKREDCERFGRTCWWGVKDLPKYHVPLRSAHIRSWCHDIDEGKATPQCPGPAVIQRMMRLQHARQTAVAPAPAAQELNMHFHGMASTFKQTLQVNGVNLHLSFYGPEYNLGHVWGGFRLLESQFSTIERREQFKTWCLSTAGWNGEHSRVEKIISALADEGFDVEGIAYSTAYDWKACGLPERYEKYRVKMNQTAETWMISHGAVRREGPTRCLD